MTRPLSVLAALAAWTSPAAASSAPEPPIRGGTLRIAAWAEPVNLSHLLVQSGLEREISRLITVDPIYYDDQTRFTTPSFESFPTQKNRGISKDGKSWTLKVKKGLTWHDGKPVTSGDFAFAFEKGMDPKVEFVGKTDLAIVDRVETPDDRTIVFRLKKRSGAFFEYIPHPLPRHLLAKSADFNRDPYHRSPIGNGPFEFVEWAAASHITLKRRSDAPDAGPPWLDRVIYRIIPDENNRWIEMQNGGLDQLRTSTLDVVEKARNDPRFSVVPVVNTNWTNIAFNCESPILKDRRVREAFVRAIDKETVAKQVVRQRPLPIYGLGPHAAKYYTDDVPRYPHDPALSAKLLDEAGWKMGSDGIRQKNGKPLVLRFATLSGNKPWQDLQVIFQDYAKKSGIKLQLEGFPGSKYYASVASGGVLSTGDFDVALLAWGGGSAYLLGKQLFHSTSFPPEASNFHRYKNEAVDRLLERAEESLEPAAQIRFAKEAQKKILEDLPVWPLYVYESYHIVSSRLRGYAPGPFSTYAWNGQDWWLTR